MLKSERHHWWPRCVSRHWADVDGNTGWITNTGDLRRLRPYALGQIGNGHHIKGSHTPGESDPWDTSFEHEFNLADSTFPDTIQWLESLECEAKPDQPLCNRFLAQSASDDQLRLLTESAVSLAVRSPRFRERCVALAEDLRGPLSEAERNALIGMNMRHAQRSISDSLGTKAKYAVLLTREREFIYGDGFFQNVSGTAPQFTKVRLLAPITPTMSVMIFQPSHYHPEPRLSAIVLTETEVAACNDAVQIYSGRDLFFRSQEPILLAEFTSGQYMSYASTDNPIDGIMDNLPGVPQRHRLRELAELDTLRSKNNEGSSRA
jgi:hypothetical protein